MLKLMAFDIQQLIRMPYCEDFPKYSDRFFSVSFSLFLSHSFTAVFHFHAYGFSTAKLSVSQQVGWVVFLVVKNQSKKRLLSMKYFEVYTWR